MRMLQIVGVKGPSWNENGYANSSSSTFDGFQGESDIWADLDTDLYHWTKALRPVQVIMCQLICLMFVLHHFETLGAESCLDIGQWFPGHIAKAEKELKEQLKLMDVVIEVRDGRIPMSTSHPQASFSLNHF